MINYYKNVWMKTKYIRCSNKFSPFLIKNWAFNVKGRNLMFYSKYIVHRIVLLAFGTILDPIMLPIRRLSTISAFRYVLWLRCQIHRSLTFEITHSNFSHLRQPLHMFVQAIDAPQLQIYSNRKIKSKVPANDAYSA